MRKTDTFSAFEINDSSKYGFSPEEYSKFKYGSKNIAEKYGYILADRFIAQYGPALQNKQLVVIPSAFSHIKTASHVMETYFVDKLNFHLFKNDQPPVEQTKICRTVTYREDYGEMTAEERYNLIKGDKFHIDKTFLGNKVLIFIDDIKITGTHERIIIKMLDDFDITNDCYMLYFAELKATDINPKIENYLNQHFVKNLQDLDTVIKHETFEFNTRVVKFILNSDHFECISFLKKQSQEFIRDLFYLAIGNHYGQFSDYKRNLVYIQNLIEKMEEHNEIQNKAKSSITF